MVSQIAIQDKAVEAKLARFGFAGCRPMESTSHSTTRPRQDVEVASRAHRP